MQVTFLGVGEACDPDLFNTSLLIQTGGQEPGHVLLDCGFTGAHRFFAQLDDPEKPEALWISHFHGDHYFGAPLLLLRLWEMQRQNPLIILGPPGLEDVLSRAMDLAYPNFRSKLGYPIEYHQVGPADELDLLDCRWSFAWSEHGRDNLALRLDDGRASVYYSGDGGPSPACRTMAAGCSLIVQESYLVQDEIAGHGSVRSSLDLARRAGAPQLALVHMQRQERRRFAPVFQAEYRTLQDVQVLLPEPGQNLLLEG